MASIGTRKNPAVVRAQTQERAVELLDFCKGRGIQAIIEPARPLSESKCADVLSLAWPCPTPGDSLVYGALGLT